MNTLQTQTEVLEVIQKNLRYGDIKIIARRAGYSVEYTGMVLSVVHSAYNDKIVGEAVKLIEERQQDNKNLLKKISPKTPATPITATYSQPALNL